MYVAGVALLSLGHKPSEREKGDISLFLGTLLQSLGWAIKLSSREAQDFLCKTNSPEKSVSNTSPVSYIGVEHKKIGM
jgi:hypothetical protein